MLLKNILTARVQLQDESFVQCPTGCVLLLETLQIITAFVPQSMCLELCYDFLGIVPNAKVMKPGELIEKQ